MIDAAGLLLQARSRRGLSQRELASRAGTAASTVSKIERGRMTPSVELLDHLLAAAGYQLAPLLTETAHPDDGAITSYLELTPGERIRRSVALHALFAGRAVQR